MENIKIKVREGMSSFSASEQKIATFIIEDFENAVNLPVAELSKKSGVSKATWVRFSKTLGFTGLKELKRAMVSDLSQLEPKADSFSDVCNTDTTECACNNIALNSIKSIEDTFSLMNVETLELVRDKILTAKTVRLFGMGASGVVAQDLYFKLIRIGINAIFTMDLHINFTSVSATDKDDLVIVFSHSGQTREIVEIANIGKSHGAYVVAITKYSKNQLLDTVDNVIYTSSVEQEKRSGAMGSRIAQLMVVDTLFTIVAKKSFGNIEGKLLESYNVAKKHKI